MFSPYHKFAACELLERKINELSRSNNIPDDILKRYNKYHFSLIYKLRCARYQLDRLNDLLINTLPQDIVSDSNNFLFFINMKIDGFFYSCGSALDILAREILIYFNIPLPNRVYFHTARDILNAHYPNDTLLDKLSEPGWKSEFSNYRNALTHEVLIAGEYSINVKMDGNTQRSEIVFPLPDDPRLDIEQRTYRRNPDALAYCKTTFRRILSTINQIYTELIRRIDDQGCLPLK